MIEQRKPIPWYWWAVAALMLLVAYVLSAGPAVMLCGHGPSFATINQVYRVIYAPVIWVNVNAPDQIWMWLDWYFSLWRNVP